MPFSRVVPGAIIGQLENARNRVVDCAACVCRRQENARRRKREVARCAFVVPRQPQTSLTRARCGSVSATPCRSFRGACGSHPTRNAGWGLIQPSEPWGRQSVLTCSAVTDNAEPAAFHSCSVATVTTRVDDVVQIDEFPASIYLSIIRGAEVQLPVSCCNLMARSAAAVSL